MRPNTAKATGGGSDPLDELILNEFPYPMEVNCRRLLECMSSKSLGEIRCMNKRDSPLQFTRNGMSSES